MTHDQRVGELADRSEIANLLATYREHLDEYDIDGMAATFTEDVVTDYGPVAAVR